MSAHNAMMRKALPPLPSPLPTHPVTARRATHSAVLTLLRRSSSSAPSGEKDDWGASTAPGAGASAMGHALIVPSEEELKTKFCTGRMIAGAIAHVNNYAA